MEQKHFINFCKGLYEKQLGVTILNQEMSFEDFSIFSSGGGLLIRRSETI